jgi:tetratricopeptide (TPR) repeat protein
MILWLVILAQASTNPEDAIRALRAQELATPTAVIKKRLAHQYYLVRQHKLFELKMKEAAALDPGDPDPPYFLGRFYLAEREDKVEALNWLNKALSVRPGDPRTLAALGDALEKDGQLVEAQARYRQSIRATPTAAAWAGLARCSLAFGEPETAESQSRRALALSPLGEAWWVLGQALLARRQWESGYAALREAAAKLPHEPAILFQEARALRMLNRRAEADACLERWRELSELLGRPVDQRQK